MIRANNTPKKNKSKGPGDKIVSLADRKKAKAKQKARLEAGSGKQNFKYEPLVSKADREKAKAKQKAMLQGRGYQQWAGGLSKRKKRAKSTSRIGANNAGTGQSPRMSTNR